MSKKKNKRALLSFSVSPRVCMSSRSAHWQGLETLRQRLREAAVEVRESDAALRRVMPDTEATGRIMIGLRDAATAESCSELRRAVDAQLALQRIVSSLVQDYGMDFYVVRCEWAVIVDPSDGNRKRCAEIMKRHAPGK